MKKLALAIVSFLITIPPLHAATSANGQLFRPATDISRYLSVYGSETLPQKKFHLGVIFNWANDPVELRGAGTSILFGNVVADLFMGDFLGSFGITDWLQAGLDIPVAFALRYADPTRTAIAAPTETSIRMGDIRLDLKLRLLDGQRYPVGISLRPFIDFPTGSGSRFVGNNSIAGGGDLIFDASFWDRLQTSLNIGILARKGVIPTGFVHREDEKLRIGFGFNVRTFRFMDLIGEVHAHPLLKDLFQFQEETPVEGIGGVRLFPEKNWQVDVAAGRRFTIGFGAPDFRIVLGVRYSSQKRESERPASTEPSAIEEPLARIDGDEIVISEIVHFEFDKARIRPVSFQVLDAVVKVLKGHPEIKKVAVEGHTDHDGSDAYNLRLSRRRAKAVIEYLIAHGIERDRLTAKGEGEKTPFDTNETDLGRARNRRTEFHIIETSPPSEQEPEVEPPSSEPSPPALSPSDKEELLPLVVQ